MGYPGSGMEGMYRNSIGDVARFLSSRHGEDYMVFNLSERPYDNRLFGNRVLESGFPDHFAPPVALCWVICKTMDGWLEASPKHAAVVHCLAGKGRTGVIIACYLLFSGYCLRRHITKSLAAASAGAGAGAGASALSNSAAPSHAADTGRHSSGAVPVTLQQPAAAAAAAGRRMSGFEAALERAGVLAGRPGAGGAPLGVVVASSPSAAAPVGSSSAGRSPSMTAAGLHAAVAAVPASHPIFGAPDGLTAATPSSGAGAALDTRTRRLSALGGPCSADAMHALSAARARAHTGGATGAAAAAADTAAAGAAGVGHGTPPAYAAGARRLSASAAPPCAACGASSATNLGAAMSGPALCGACAKAAAAAAPSTAAAVAAATAARAEEANNPFAGPAPAPGPGSGISGLRTRSGAGGGCASAAASPVSPPLSPHAHFLLPPASEMAREVLALFQARRGEGVKYPSQERTVRYFARVVHDVILAEQEAILREEAEAAAAAARGAADVAAAAAVLSEAEGSGAGVHPLMPGSGPAAPAPRAAVPSSAGGASGSGTDAGPLTVPAATSASRASVSSLPARSRASTGSGTPLHTTDDGVARLTATLERLLESTEVTEPVPVRVAAAERLRSLRSLPTPKQPPLLLHKVIMSGIPDLPGGFTPLLHICTAPFQGGTTRLIYNSAWHSARAVTYTPSDGMAVFTVRAIVQGDLLVSVKQLPGETEQFRFSFQTMFMQQESEAPGVYRLWLRDVDMEKRKEKVSHYPADWFIDLFYSPVEVAAPPVAAPSTASTGVSAGSGAGGAGAGSSSGGASGPPPPPTRRTAGGDSGLAGAAGAGAVGSQHSSGSGSPSSMRLPQPPAFAVPLATSPAATAASGGGLQGVATSRSISGESTGSAGSSRIAPAAASTAASAARVSVRGDSAVSASAAAAAAAAMEAGLSARTFRTAPPLAPASAAMADPSAGPAPTGPTRRSSGHVRQLSGTPPPQTLSAAASSSSPAAAAAAVRPGGEGSSSAPRAPPPAPPRSGLPCGSSPIPSPSSGAGTGAGRSRAGEVVTPTEASLPGAAGGAPRSAGVFAPAAAASGASPVPPLSPGLSTAPSLASSCRTDSAESGASLAPSVASGGAGAGAASKRSPRLSEHRNALLSALLPPPRGPRPSAGTVTPGGIAALVSDGDAGAVAGAAASASPRSACAASGIAATDTDAAAAAADAEASSGSQRQARSPRSAVDSADSSAGASGVPSGGKGRGVRMSVLQPGRSHELGAEQLHDLLDWAGFDEDEEEGGAEEEETDDSDSDGEPGKPSLRRVAHRSHTGADRVASPAQPRSAGAGGFETASPSASRTHAHSHSNSSASAASTASAGTSPRSLAAQAALPTAAGPTPPALPQPHRSQHSGVGASSPAITIGASCPEAVHARHLLRVPSAGGGTDTSLAHSGWLMKRGQGAFAGWKRRWFVLQAAAEAAGGVGSPPFGVLAGAGAVPEPTPPAASGATVGDGAGGQLARTALLYYYEQPTDSEPRGVIPLTAASIARTVAGAARPAGSATAVAADGAVIAAGADPVAAAIPARSPALSTSASGSRSSIPGSSAGAGASDRCFAIQRQGRTHLLQASTAEEAATWLSAIASVVA